MNTQNDMDALLDVLIDKAAKNSIAHMEDGFPEPAPVEFSREHTARMKKLFRREKNKLLRQRAARVSRRAAAIVLAAAVLSGVTIYSVKAWRVRFLNFIIEMTQTDTDINFVEDASKSDSYRSDEITLDYIPDGFKLESSDIRSNTVYLIFVKDEKTYRFTMRKIDAALAIDTEGSFVKRLIINGNEAIHSVNDDINILVWHDNEYSYSLSGNIEEAELVKIAENVKK